MRYHVIGWIVLAGLAWPASTLADAGPKPDDSFHIIVTRGQQPLGSGEFTAAMLSLQEKPNARKLGGAALPGLEQGLVAETGQGVWTYAGYYWGGDGHDGQVSFGGFFAGRPLKFRVALQLPGEDRLFVSNEAESHPLLNRYQLDLEGNGKAALVRIETGRWLVDVLLALADHGFYGAWAMTILLEALVTWGFVFWLGKRSLLRRNLLLAVAVNFLSVPVVWALAVCGFWLAGLWHGLTFLAVLEVAVVLCEGLVYAVLGRLGWRGLGLSAIANLASFLAGILLGLR